ncbi:MAG: DUF928 domain-containing protein [Phormidesmis sp.]
MSIRQRLLNSALIGLTLLSVTTSSSKSLIGFLGATPAHGQNPIQRIWDRFVSRPSRDQRPETIGRGGANRDRCPATEQELTALVPMTDTSEVTYLEKTTQSHPTWYFYSPYPPRLGLNAEFTLIDSEETIVYQEVLPLSDVSALLAETTTETKTPGIMSLKLPPDGIGLAIGQRYRWIFSIICTPSNRSADAAVNGWIERISSETITTDIDALNDSERIEFYTENFLWFDAVSELANLQDSNSPDSEWTQAWQALLDNLKINSTDTSIRPLR